MVSVTAGVNALDIPLRLRVFEAVQKFTKFEPGNDPYGEHDYGRLEVEGTEVLRKIDYYDLQHTYFSDDPSDPGVTRRVLTIMLAEEY